MKGWIFFACAVVIGAWMARSKPEPKVVEKTKPTPRYIYRGSGRAEPGESDKYDFTRAIAGKRAAERRDKTRQRLHAKSGVKATPPPKNVKPFPQRKIGSR